MSFSEHDPMLFPGGKWLPRRGAMVLISSYDHISGFVSYGTNQAKCAERKSWTEELAAYFTSVTEYA